MTTSSPSNWFRENFLCSTDHSLLQKDVIEKAFESDLVYWTKAGSPDLLDAMLKNSLCFGIYALPQSTAELAGRKNPPQIGLARVITDYVTFAYLTDVFVLEEYQGKGLGTWMMECMNEVFETWPELRRIMLMTNDTQGQAYYKKTMGMAPFKQGEKSMVVLSKRVHALVG